MSKTKKNLIIIFSIVGVLVLLMVVFGALFSLRTINIDYATGTNRVEAYTKERIVEESGIKLKSNVVFANYEKAEQNLESKFPYAKFNIVRTFPNKIVIYIYEREPVFRVLNTEGMWEIYDEELKCLEVVAPANLSEFSNNEVPVLSGAELSLCGKAGGFIDNQNFSQKLTTIIDGVYGSSKTPINIMSDIILSNNDILGISEVSFKIKASGTTLVIQGTDYLKEKIAYCVYIYSKEISQDSEFSTKLDKVTITVLNNFNPNDSETVKFYISESE